MNNLSNMPTAGVVVIMVIIALFALSLVLLFSVYLRYKGLTRSVKESPDPANRFMRSLVNDYAAAYKRYGTDVNTPAIIENTIATRLGSSLMCERFLNNAVSLFVTLGLFGTFLGLSLSVVSLSELLGYSDSSEWLSVLDSVGSGLMSALSGMGVAFYTSLVSVACSILLTILRVIVNPESQRAKLETQLELWLDHSVAPTLKTTAAKDDVDLVHQMIDAMNDAANAMDKTLGDVTLKLQQTMDASRTHLGAFNQTVNNFNEGVRDFDEFNYNLRGTVERLDVAIRDVVSVVRQTGRDLERSAKQ
ncbi:MAG: hypothetical protein IJZ91_03650 [Oscillospiraceae bacterium]|nr:hypothetical protein [Oscillospiraceae bacterium]